MSSLVKHESPDVVPRLQEEINRLFGNVFGSDSSAATVNWAPAVDILEFSDRFDLYVDLPGVDAAKVDLTLEDGVLTICGERAEDAVAPRGEAPQYRRTERGQGRFYRRFVLPDTVDGDKVRATGRNGVLTITIPKQARAMPRRIQIGA